VTGRAGADLMFGREWKQSHQLRPMRQACERAKIEPPVGFHQLRHTWASLSIKGGVPLPIVAKNLGHADTRMVEKHYGHLDEDHVTKTIRDRAPRFGKVASNVKAL
jgi:integrase